MAKILLVSRGEDESFILRRKLESLNSELDGIEFVSLRPAAVPNMLDRDVVLIIHTMQKLENATHDFIEQTRKSGYRGPCLMIAKPDKAELTQKIRQMPGVILLEKPYENKDLLGIIQKFLDTRKVAQQWHRRFPTSQKADVKINPNDQPRPSVVFNISRGGAYLEFPKTMPVRTGDTLSMNIQLGDLKRTYLMPARVVWTTPIGMCGGYGVGVEFTGPGKVSSDLMRG